MDVGLGLGLGEPPLPPVVNGWNTCVKAPLAWEMPLQVDDA